MYNAIEYNKSVLCYLDIGYTFAFQVPRVQGIK